MSKRKARRQGSAKRPPAGAAHARRLLAWYDRARRRLPWRAEAGERADPSRVWLSEIMLQQTTVAAVGPYFARFLARWPDVAALAAAPLDDVLAEWQGLGYYARARNLKKCAETVARDHGGVFPATGADLQKLPGIGPYTAGAIAAIAFDEPATVVDGNVERVVARLFAVEDPLPAAKPRLRELAAALTPSARAGDYAQAMMDLGATVCVPRSPRCDACPLSGDCAGRALGIAGRLPARARKAPRPTRRAVAWLALNRKGEVLLRRRAETGLLGGMWEVPSSEWLKDGGFDAAPPAPARWHRAGGIEHVFTHFRLEMEVRRALLPSRDIGRFGKHARWVGRADIASYALPSVMKKAIKLGAPGLLA